MAAFLQDFTIVQSNDCTTLTFTDNSNFGDNDQGYTFSSFTLKQIVLYDYQTNILATLTIVDSTPVTYSIGSDLYISAVYTLQHLTDTALVKTYNVALSCYTDLIYGQVVAENIDCNDSNDRLFNIVKGLSAAQIFAQRGNAALSQDCLNLASSYATDCNAPTITTKNGGCGCNS